MMRRKWVYAGSVAAALIVTAAGMWYVSRIVFAESLYTEKGTLAYWMVVRSNIIRGFPKPGLIGEERYYYSCGDGPKPAAEGVLFSTSNNRTQIYGEADRFLKEMGFSKVSSESEAVRAYWRGDTCVSIESVQEDGALKIIVLQEKG